MNRVTVTLTTLVLLGVAVNQPAARGDKPTSAPIVFSSGKASTVWSGNLHAVNHRNHHGYYGGYGGNYRGYGGYYGGYGGYYGPRIPVPSPFWTPPTVVVPYVAPPTVAYPSVYGAPGCYYYGPNSFQYYGPRFSFGLSF